ncbi:MAG TPA: deoxyribodipyrimidine photo-lyase, partial [Acidobacteriota bacterium]|nr:deoxyribodipyrimidine photo-lyase [Acidobacteriota bacterium]
MTNHSHTLFIFHRDLRLEDNTALIRACLLSRKVSFAFIFDKRQFEDNPY